MKVLLTGGCGFIGSNLVRQLVRNNHQVLNFDKLTYAGNPNSLADLDGNPNHQLIVADICDPTAVADAIENFRPDWIMHLAAESHVDRSIDGPGQFIQTNVVGTFNLLNSAKSYWQNLDARDKANFRFLHVSTDEVYGSLGPEGYFTETTPYDPHSPYSASKASSDHLARAWHDTYGLPVLVTNCSNNYGPYQFPEKLIPVVILKALRGDPIPVYGKGENIRDWLYVEDHCLALEAVISRGRVGQTYNIGGNNEKKNIDLVRLLCDLIDHESPRSGLNEAQSTKNKAPRSALHSPLSPLSDLPLEKSQIRGEGSGVRGEKKSSSLITHVADRPGHDLRYAIDASKIKRELGWEPQQDHQSGFRKTVQWYLDNRDWWETILSGEYQLERLGKSA